MDEWIDIIDSHENFMFKALKSEAHAKGLAHSSIHLWLYNNAGNLLIQKRSESKKCYPNLWDVSVAGHVLSGENPIQAAIRECKEETGFELKAQNLFFFGKNHKQKVHASDFIDHEYQHLFLANCNLEVSEFQIQIEELSEVKWISFQELNQAWSEKDQNFVPRNHLYSELLEKNLKSRLQS